MDNIYIVMLMLILHWIGDFLFQTRQMADNKSSSLYWLTSHVLWYCVAFTPMFFIIGEGTAYIEFMVLLFSTHWITDLITSKITTLCWKKQKIKLFFTVIGFDQLIHALTLLYLYKIFVEPFVFI